MTKLRTGPKTEVFYFAGDVFSKQEGNFVGIDEDFVYLRNNIGEIVAINRERITTIVQPDRRFR